MNKLAYIGHHGEKHKEQLKSFISTTLTAKDTQIAEAEQKGRDMAVDYIEKELPAGYLDESNGLLGEVLKSARQENL